MDNLSEDSKDLLRDMVKSEAWRIYETIQQGMIEESRRLATQQTVALENRLWFSALAQGREEAITGIKDVLYVRQSK